MSEQKGNPVVGIAGVIGGVSVAIVMIFAIFAKDQISITPWIVGALVILGIALGFFSRNISKPL